MLVACFQRLADAARRQDVVFLDQDAVVTARCAGFPRRRT